MFVTNTRTSSKLCKTHYATPSCAPLLPSQKGGGGELGRGKKKAWEEAASSWDHGHHLLSNNLLRPMGWRPPAHDKYGPPPPHPTPPCIQHGCLARLHSSCLQHASVLQRGGRHVISVPSQAVMGGEGGGIAPAYDKHLGVAAACYLYVSALLHLPSAILPIQQSGGRTHPLVSHGGRTA